MDKQDSYGNTSFLIEFATGEKGYYTSKDADQKKFVVGSETEFNLETKPSKSGSTYNKITLPQSEQKFGGKPQQDPRVQMISFSMSYTKDLVVAGKVDMKAMEETFERIYSKMLSKI